MGDFMNIILNTNSLGYKPFLDCPVDSFIIGLKDFCINQKYNLSIKNLPLIINEIKNKNKKIYISINDLLLEKKLSKFKKIFNQLILLDIDGFIVSDLGVLNVFIENNLQSKVILDLQTYITNKYSAKSLLDFGIKRICVSKEITLEDIKEISIYNKGNIEVLCQGYTSIAYSKRPILDCYYKKYKLNKNKETHYIKEESRDNYYYLNQEKNILTVYNDKQYSLFNILPNLIESEINNFRIDANFLNEEEIKEYINYYRKGIDLITKNDLNSFNNLKEEFNNKFEFDSHFLYNKSFLLKEGK